MHMYASLGSGKVFSMRKRPILSCVMIHKVVSVDCMTAVWHDCIEATIGTRAD